MSDLIEKCTEVNDKVNQLIKDHKIQEAYDLLKNELSSSYVPEPFLKD
ncbi:hypothetical protein IKS57_01650 [bacterium]|nr:hypothetical protein [bacterium]